MSESCIHCRFLMLLVHLSSYSCLNFQGSWEARKIILPPTYYQSTYAPKKGLCILLYLMSGWWNTTIPDGWFGPFFIFPLGMSSSQLTNSYFSEGCRSTTNQIAQFGADECSAICWEPQVGQQSSVNKAGKQVLEIAVLTRHIWVLTWFSILNFFDIFWSCRHCRGFDFEDLTDIDLNESHIFIEPWDMRQISGAWGVLRQAPRREIPTPYSQGAQSRSASAPTVPGTPSWHFLKASACLAF